MVSHVNPRFNFRFCFHNFRRMDSLEAGLLAPPSEGTVAPASSSGSSSIHGRVTWSPKGERAVCANQGTHDIHGDRREFKPYHTEAGDVISGAHAQDHTAVTSSVRVESLAAGTMVVQSQKYQDVCSTLSVYPRHTETHPYTREETPGTGGDNPTSRGLYTFILLSYNITECVTK